MKNITLIILTLLSINALNAASKLDPTLFATDYGTHQLIQQYGLGQIPSAQNQSLLHIAAQEGRELALRTLIYNGADVNLLDKNGRSPLDFAVIFNHPSCLALLLEHGTDIEKNIQKLRLHLLQEQPIRIILMPWYNC